MSAAIRIELCYVLSFSVWLLASLRSVPGGEFAVLVLIVSYEPSQRWLVLLR